MTEPIQKTMSAQSLKEIDWAAQGLQLSSSSDRIQFEAALGYLQFFDVDKFRRVADIGSGPGHQSFVLKTMGADVTCVDFRKPAYDELRWLSPDHLGELQGLDAIWSHHCLEHIRDPIGALISWRRALKPSGALFLTVPQFDVAMSSGHITLYNLPLLMYHLAVAGYNCSKNCFIKQGSHLRAFVTRDERYDPEQKVVTGLTELAKLGLFSPSVTKAIEETGRFSSESIVLRWFGRVLKPAAGGTQMCAYVADSLWRDG